MRSALAKVLDLPWTIIGLVVVILSFPKRFSLHRNPFSIIADVRSFWWYVWLPGQKGVRAMTIGNVVLLGPRLEKGDLEHELIHVEQYERMPLIFPLLELIEKVKNGNRYSKYENEAYARARNIWRGETKSLQMAREYLGRNVSVMIDRPLGSEHPKHAFLYHANYGHVPNTKAPDGEELDAYYLGIDKPLKEASGICVAVVHRLNDDDDKLIVVPQGTNMTDEQILSAIHFQEQWFDVEVVR